MSEFGGMTDHNLAEDIANQLRRDILRGKLLPGAPIKERDNAADLGVSRTPMREAIRILAKERLVLLRPSRSPIVAQTSFKETADQVIVLLTLEKLSAELACQQASAEEIAEIRAVNDKMVAAYDTAEYLDLFEMDMQFHTLIAQASHNEPLAETHRTYLARLWRARYLAAQQRRNRERVMSHHTAILNAIATKDIEAVRVAIDAHLGHLAEDIRPVLESEQAESP